MQRKGNIWKIKYLQKTDRELDFFELETYHALAGGVFALRTWQPVGTLSTTLAAPFGPQTTNVLALARLTKLILKSGATIRAAPIKRRMLFMVLNVNGLLPLI